MLGSLNRNPAVILSKLHSSVWMNWTEWWVMKPEILGEAWGSREHDFIEWFNDTSIFLVFRNLYTMYKIYHSNFLWVEESLRHHPQTHGLEFSVWTRICEDAWAAMASATGVPIHTRACTILKATCRYLPAARWQGCWEVVWHRQLLRLQIGWRCKNAKNQHVCGAETWSSSPYHTETMDAFGFLAGHVGAGGWLSQYGWILRDGVSVKSSWFFSEIR